MTSAKSNQTVPPKSQQRNTPHFPKVHSDKTVLMQEDRTGSSSDTNGRLISRLPSLRTEGNNQNIKISFI